MVALHSAHGLSWGTHGGNQWDTDRDTPPPSASETETESRPCRHSEHPTKVGGGHGKQCPFTACGHTEPHGTHGGRERGRRSPLCMSSRCTARWDSPTGDPSSGGKELGGHGGSTGGGHCKMSRSRSTALQPHTSTAPHIRSPTDPQPGCALLPFQLIAERFYRELLLISGSKAHPGCPGPSANSTSTLQHCYSAAYHPPSPPPGPSAHTLLL